MSISFPSPGQAAATPERLMKWTRDILENNGEWTPAMQEVYNSTFSEEITGSRASGLERYRILCAYPKECERIGNLGLELVCPGFLEKTQKSFTNNLPLYRRVIVKGVNFITKPIVLKTMACAAVVGVFFYPRLPTLQVPSLPLSWQK